MRRQQPARMAAAAPLKPHAGDPFAVFKARLPSILPVNPSPYAPPSHCSPKMYGDGYEMGEPLFTTAWLRQVAHTLRALLIIIFTLACGSNCTAPQLCSRSQHHPALASTSRAGDTYGSMDYSSADGYGSYGEMTVAK